MEIPVYKWDPDSGPSLTDLNSLQRYPLKTYYLQRDYNGQNESHWHLVNEPYYYNTTGIDNIPGNPESFYLKQNFPNPFKNTTRLSFHIPGEGHVGIDILNINGQVIETIADKQLTQGDHTITWNSGNHLSGLYICRINYAGIVRTRKMMVFH